MTSLILEDEDVIGTPVEEFELTEDQQIALERINQFLTDPSETAFVLRGYSGCGKSTLVRRLLDQLPSYMRMARLVNPSLREYTVQLTATTNKAAENLAYVSGMPAETIHKFLGLRVQTNYQTNVTTLIPRSYEPKEGYLLFIDEASYIDRQMLKYIFELTKHCKIVFIGDPAQLTPVKSTTTPVFDAKLPGAELKEPVRQKSNNGVLHPIAELGAKFRHAVNTGESFQFTPDGVHIQHMDKATFKKAIEDEFTRPDWRYRDSKVLAWTNKRVIEYNHHIRNISKGDPHFQVGDDAVCNSFLTVGKASLKTDQMVQITAIEDGIIRHDVPGKYYTLDGGIRVFGPNSIADKAAAIKRARLNNQINQIQEMEMSWIDLRAAYACTVNKAQGSTFDTVFLDLDDIRRCTSGDQLYRMMYVASTRPRHHLYMYGDLA